MCRLAFAILVFELLPALTAQDQPDKEKPKPPAEEGFPVTSQLVVSKCSPCHKQDEKGRLTRISWERTTPEGWQEVIKRMVRLNGLVLSPDEARAIVRYLATNHGLALEEAKPALYEVERRMKDEPVPNESVQKACMACHTLGRAMSWRQSREEWELLANMHMGYFPLVETINFRRPPPPPNAPPPAAGTDTRDPLEQALEYLAKNFPLHTPEWSAWRASMRTPKLSGRWLISGARVGHGRIYGEMTIEPAATEDGFTTQAKLFHVQDGTTSTRSGRVTIYTGYAWRGRSQSQDGTDPKEWREVMLVSRDQSQIEGRWFWGAYDEFGIDVTLRRAGNDPVVFGVDRESLQAGTKGVRMRIYGHKLPADLKAADIDFGSGVAIKGIAGRDADSVTVEVDVEPGAITGRRDVAVRGAVATSAFAVFDRIDYLKVNPEASMARLGGAAHPKGYQQFEAIAYNRGPDNKPHTADDVNLGPVEAEWSVEEFFAVYGDDDKEFVGTLSPRGFFTPAPEGPNPKRKFGRNNYGDVWIVATYKPKNGETGKEAKPIVARGHLVVTIPLYVRWDQPEVAE